MKSSRYNYSFSLPDGTTLLLNFFTLALIALDKTESDLGVDILANPDKSLIKRKAYSLRKLLIEKGFIIEDEVNELDLLRVANFRSRLDQKHLGLTIALTLSCNFECVYCYQGEKKQHMTPEVEAALVDFVKARLVDEGKLSVTWYGGEPLLKLGLIERLSKSFISICESKKVQYSASIITNGFLLDKDTAEKLADFKISDTQITIDGPPDIHNVRRPLKGGGETYAGILENVKNAADKLNINIRMNVDDRNRDRIREFLDLLVQEGLAGKVGFYLGHAYPYTEACSDVSSFCIGEKDFSLLGLETSVETLKRGLGSSGNLASKNHWCMADSENAFVITPSGGIIKCWNEVANRQAEAGHLLKPVTRAMQDNIERWRKRDPFELECGQCLLLPVCMGGCPYLYQRTGQIDCHGWKHNLEASVYFYYLLNVVKQESQIIDEFKGLVQDAKQTANKFHNQGKQV